MKIIEKKVLAQTPQARIIRISLIAPEIACKALPGQFVVLMVQEEGERIPLTVVSTNQEKGTVSLIFQEVGLTTKLLGRLEIGDSLYAVAGPLGHASELKKYGDVILVGGGVGIAEIYPVAKGLKDAGNRISVILGARSKPLLILEEELKTIADSIYAVTDDGSSGRKGFTTDILEELLGKGKFDLVYAVGPIPMMAKTARITSDHKIPTIVSLNALMVDATGMCGCCRVTVAGALKFSCVDGPEFDAGLVDWEELVRRNQIYQQQEKHICKLKIK